MPQYSALSAESTRLGLGTRLDTVGLVQRVLLLGSRDGV